MSKRIFEISSLLIFAIILIGIFVAKNEMIVSAQSQSSPGPSPQSGVFDRTKTSVQPTIKVPEDAPKIVFEKTFYDFGDTFSGEDLKYSFTFTNKGKSMLIIDKVKAG